MRQSATSIFNCGFFMSDHPRPVAPAGPPLNHELSDADPRPILKFLAFLVGLTIVVAIVVVFFYNFLEHREAAEKTARCRRRRGCRPIRSRTSRICGDRRIRC